MTTMTSEVLVIGAGPAGMMAALAARERGLSVGLIERNKLPGRKLGLTGKGRCNLTNNCGLQELVRNTPGNGKFLYRAFAGWSSADTMAFFEGLGVPLKTERGNRVFPVSDRATDITRALDSELGRAGVRRIRGRAREIVAEGGRVCGVRVDGELLPCRAVVLATGGLSYPVTGSTGDGYRMAEALGHRILPCRASIVALASDDPDCGALQGLTLKNIAVRAEDADKKTVYEDFGELLFTHFGLSGPVILSMSAHLRDFSRPYTVRIDLKPALDEKALHDRLLRDFAAAPNKDFGHILWGLLPRAMAPIVALRCGIAAEKKANAITREERASLVAAMKGFTIPVRGTRPVEEAVVTAGGVDVREIDPGTMRSRLVEGLSFAGEIMDVDAYTGGYNLQIAWSTGRMAGRSLEIS